MAKRESKNQAGVQAKLATVNRAKAAVHRGDLAGAIKALRGVDRARAERLAKRLEAIRAEILGLG